MENDICENSQVNISNLWNISFILSANIDIAHKNNCFFPNQDDIIRTYLKMNMAQFNSYFKKYKTKIIERGEIEIEYWGNRIYEIKQYNREQAIEELLSSLKLNEKISSIKRYIDSLRDDYV